MKGCRQKRAQGSHHLKYFLEAGDITEPITVARWVGSKQRHCHDGTGEDISNHGKSWANTSDCGRR